MREENDTCELLNTQRRVFKCKGGASTLLPGRSRCSCGRARPVAMKSDAIYGNTQISLLRAHPSLTGRTSSCFQEFLSLNISGPTLTGFVWASQMFPWSPGVTLGTVYVRVSSFSVVIRVSVSSCDIRVLGWSQIYANQGACIYIQMAYWLLELYSLWVSWEMSFSSDQLFQRCFTQQGLDLSNTISLCSTPPFPRMDGSSRKAFFFFF